MSSNSRALEPLEPRRLLSAGDVETTFGQNGVLTFNRRDVDSDVVAFDRNGNLLMAGRNSVMRITRTGAVDQTFGIGGKLDVGFRAAGIHVGSDGKIIVGGSIENRWIVARFNPDWTPDVTFGDGGRRAVTVGAAETTASASSLAIFPGGDIILAGKYLPDDPEWDIDYTHTALARFNSDGSVDNDFGGDGIVIGGSPHWSNEVRNVLAKPDGNVILLAHTWSGGHTNWPWLVEYDAKGESVNVGTEYGPIPQEYYGQYRGGTVRPDGAVVISQSDYVVPPSRLFLNGRQINVDFSPGVSAEEWAGPVTSDAWNRIIVAGHSTRDNQDTLGVQRFTRDGLPDTSFGTNGSASSGLPYDTEYVRAVAVAPDGDIVATAHLPGNDDFIMVRFDGGPRRRIVRPVIRPRYAPPTRASIAQTTVAATATATTRQRASAPVRTVSAAPFSVTRVRQSIAESEDRDPLR